MLGLLQAKRWSNQNSLPLSDSDGRVLGMALGLLDLALSKIPEAKVERLSTKPS